MLIPVLALALAAAPANGDARFEAFAKYIQELLDRDPETATRLGASQRRAAQRLQRRGRAEGPGGRALGAGRLVPHRALHAFPEDAVDARTLKNRLDSQIYELTTIRAWSGTRCSTTSAAPSMP